MTILQISKIINRVGNLEDLPQLDNGEFGWASDTKQLFIGNDITYTPNVSVPQNTEILTTLSTVVASVANTVSDNAQPNITSVGTLVSLTTGTVTPSDSMQNLGSEDVMWDSAYLGNILYIGGNSSAYAVTSVPVVGDPDIRTLYVNGLPLVAGTVTASAQPNISSIGNLVGLTVNGSVDFNQNLTVSGNINLGGNVTTSGKVQTAVANVGNLICTSNITLAPNITYSGTALAATDTTVAFKIPVTIGGTTYYLALTAGQ